VTTNPIKPITNVSPVEVPEDVRADLDAETRRLGIEPTDTATADVVPEDVLAERDLETREGEAKLALSLAEGTPPEDGEDRPA
jgi:hypothetical protein